MSSNERTHLQQTTAVLGAPGRNNLETRDLTVPRCAGGGRFVSGQRNKRQPTRFVLTSVILRVLSTDTSGGTVRSTEDDRARNVTAAHTRWRQQSVRPSSW